MKREKTLVLFSYDWDAIEFGRLAGRWPQLTAGFDLFSFPSNLRLAWFDMERFSRLAALRARLAGARGVVSNNEQFGALCAALIAEKITTSQTQTIIPTAARAGCSARKRST